MYRLALFAITSVLVSCQSHPLPENPKWARYSGGGFGPWKHITLLAGDHEYRSEEVVPMMTKIWKGNTDKTSRVFQITIGSAEDFRHLVVNASYWSLKRELSNRQKVMSKNMSKGTQLSFTKI